MIVTHGDEVRAHGPHCDGVSRITIACTGVAAAHFSLCLHVKSRHLGDAYRYPTGSTRSTLYTAIERQLQIQACAFRQNSGSKDLIFC
ncbi:hypothetical protein LF1_54970 [Rubripirellula obstinata]|uniref:Uncharacterized protein n=1 Tax=Rubripirellula obstinata TaxID=406547 RepID=A0A5B1CBE2_9BACT|nr:hypothetical protein [Rubripirellula obstinata]KAA1256843.1 hypothetical protein LF1_58640 [Rubripirellula obstinata]KAA1257097.1 hypothetical protein LF1_54970 [Rubripirellula obstinata]